MPLHCWSNTVQIETPVKRSTTSWRCHSKQSISLPTGSCSFVGAHQPNQSSDYRQTTAHTILTWSNPHAHMPCRCSWLSGAILCKTPTPIMKSMVISLIIFQPSWWSRSLSWSSATSTRHATLACHVALPDYLPLPFARLPHNCSRTSPMDENGSSFLKKKRAGQHFFNIEVFSSDTGCRYIFLLLTVKNGTSGARHENHL